MIADEGRMSLDAVMRKESSERRLVASLTRRESLVLVAKSAGVALVAALPSLGLLGCEDAGSRCVDEGLLSTSELSLRTAQAYVDRSPHGSDKACGGCQFYRGVESADCGDCQILGAPVSRAGYCNSWSKKTATGAG